jgi:ubiquinone/menaquinone biosynthesis C-methylase UbiE
MSQDKTQQSKSFLSGKEIHNDWKSDYLNSDINRLYDLIFNSISHKLNATRGEVILDAGCGYCYHSIRLAKLGFKVQGVDFSEQALSEARINIQKESLEDRIDIHKDDLLNLSFSDNSFNYVMCWGVLMHIPEVTQALTELCRVLKPGGKLILMENNINSLHIRLWEPILRFLKKSIGKNVETIVKSERGIEAWSEHVDGGLMVRKTDFKWLEKYLLSNKMHLTSRFASQYTELYANLKWRALKRVIYWINEQWFKRIGSYRGAMGNVIILTKEK